MPVMPAALTRRPQKITFGEMRDSALDLLGHL
jgi:hypothetical protein